MNSPFLDPSKSNKEVLPKYVFDKIERGIFIDITDGKQFDGLIFTIDHQGKTLSTVLFTDSQNIALDPASTKPEGKNYQDLFKNLRHVSLNVDPKLDLASYESFKFMCNIACQQAKTAGVRLDVLESDSSWLDRATRIRKEIVELELGHELADFLFSITSNVVRIATDDSNLNRAIHLADSGCLLYTSDAADE